MTRAVLSIALLCSACIAEEDPSLIGALDQEMISVNGTSLTGASLSGTTPSGGALGSQTLVGVSTAGTLQSGTATTAGSGSSSPWSGATLVSSTWNGTASNSVAVKLRIDSAVQGTAPNADLWFYAVSFQTTSGWLPLCGLDGSNVPIKAVSVTGQWTTVGSDTARYGASATKFTLACRTKSVAKCIELGYKPTKGYANQMSACVRMLRADYCGTGTAYTLDGTNVNLYDNVGINSDNQGWSPEAEWTATGARCVNSNNNARYELVTSKDPTCVVPLKTTTCGSSFGTGTLLIDELLN